ncbi:MAG: hypothetical protein HY608_03545 [Planctomycetes bacterium]|nr:hypothetical protein [Planctomycetota bacterium]
MWIVKNLTMKSIELPEVGVSIGPKEFFDLDVAGRAGAERCDSLARALRDGLLRTVSKQDSGASPDAEPGRAQRKEKHERVVAYREALLRNVPGAPDPADLPVPDAGLPPDPDADPEETPVPKGRAETDIRKAFLQRRPGAEPSAEPVAAPAQEPSAGPREVPAAQPSAVPPSEEETWGDFTLPEYLEEFRRSLLADVRAVFEEYLGSPPDGTNPGR